MRLLDFDPFTGIKTYFEHDAVSGKNTIKYEQDVEPVLENNFQESKTFDKKRNFWKVGTIPNNIIMKWSQECGHPPYSKDWQVYARKQLNSSEYRKINPNKIRLKK